MNYYELTTLTIGVFYEGHWYRLMCYSGSDTYLKQYVGKSDSLHNLCENIISKPEFYEIRNIMMQALHTTRCKVQGFSGIDVDVL